MSTTQVQTEPGPGNNRWWLPVLLGVLILAIIAGAYFATHPHMFGGSATATPTATATATATPRPKATPRPTNTPRPAPTSTPRPGPTGTPRPGPTGTPRPGPTATPAPRPTATPSPAGTSVSATTPKTGKVTYPPAQLQQLQNAANSGSSAAIYALSPFTSAQHDLPKLGFKTVNIVSPTPSPSPTPYTDSQGLPEVQLSVQYGGKSYLIIMVQPLKKGQGGIWIISTIRPV